MPSRSVSDARASPQHHSEKDDNTKGTACLCIKSSEAVHSKQCVCLGLMFQSGLVEDCMQVLHTFKQVQKQEGLQPLTRHMGQYQSTA